MVDGGSLHTTLSSGSNTVTSATASPDPTPPASPLGTHVAQPIAIAHIHVFRPAITRHLAEIEAADPLLALSADNGLARHVLPMVESFGDRFMEDVRDKGAHWVSTSGRDVCAVTAQKYWQQRELWLDRRLCGRRTAQSH